MLITIIQITFKKQKKNIERTITKKNLWAKIFQVFCSSFLWTVFLVVFFSTLLPFLLISAAPMLWGSETFIYCSVSLFKRIFYPYQIVKVLQLLGDFIYQFYARSHITWKRWRWLFFGLLSHCLLKGLGESRRWSIGCEENPPKGCAGSLLEEDELNIVLYSLQALSWFMSLNIPICTVLQTPSKTCFGLVEVS